MNWYSCSKSTSPSSSGSTSPSSSESESDLSSTPFDFERDVARVGKKKRTSPREDIASGMVDVENKLEGYWCKGEKCLSSCTHWVLHSSETICWDCWHDPCACSVPLEWDEAEQAYYLFFLSCDGKTKKNFWLSQPKSERARIAFRRKEKNKKESMKRRKEEEDCADNQRTAQNEGFCCHHHAKRLKLKDEE